MATTCSQCGAERRPTANFCHRCGRPYGAQPIAIRSEPTQLTSFEPLHKLSTVIADQQAWLRRNTLMEPLQAVIDNVSLRTEMERATRTQKDQILAGYQEYTSEQVQRAIDQIRQARRMADEEVGLEIKRRSLEIEDTISDRTHQRQIERLRMEHKHEKEMMELRAQLELVNAIIQSFNQVRMIQQTAQAEGLADVQQLKMLGQIIRQSFGALAEIDASQIEYARRIKELDIEHLEDAQSYELMQELVEAIMDRIAKGVTQFGA